MKNAFVIVLLTVFVFHIGGPFVIFKIQEHQIKKEILNQIKKGITINELTQITVSAANEKELLWKERNEFSYKGNMYDVVQVENVGPNTKVYHCIPDGKESKLLAKYYKDLRKRRKDKNHRYHSIKTLKFIEKTDRLPQKSNETLAEKTQHTGSVYENHYSPLAPEISSPPPKNQF